MYIEIIPNRNSPPAVLLRESFREEGKVKKRTIANLSKLPSHVVEYEKFQLNRDLIFCIGELLNQQLSTKRKFANQLHKAHELTQCTA